MKASPSNKYQPDTHVRCDRCSKEVLQESTVAVRNYVTERKPFVRFCPSCIAALRKAKQ